MLERPALQRQARRSIRVQIAAGRITLLRSPGRLEILVTLDQEGSLLQRPGGRRQLPAPGRTGLTEWLPNSSALYTEHCKNFWRLLSNRGSAVEAQQLILAHLCPPRWQAAVGAACNDRRALAPASWLAALAVQPRPAHMWPPPAWCPSHLTATRR